MEYVFLANSFVEALQGIFQTVLEKVFTPILTEILQIFINYMTNVIWTLWSEWLIAIFVLLCSLVDFLENIFNVFAGITPVEVEGESTYLLDAFLQMKNVTTAFCCITLMALAICFIFTIFKTAKSVSDMALEDRNPISKVMANGMRAAVSFMLIPFLCMFMLQVSSVITSQVIGTFDSVQGGHTTIGTIVFLSAGIDADKATTGERDIVSGEMEMQAGRNPTFNDSVRQPYLDGTYDYTDLDRVKKDFHVANFNYLAGFGCAVMLLVVLGGTILVFIRRLFDILLLYIVSPFFVSTIPLDDGAVFKKWRELFIAKFISGFGSIFSMRYYLMLVPTVMSSSLCLYDKSLPNASTIDNILKIFVIIGGAWSVYKGQSLILQVMHPEAAMAEKQAGSLVTGMVIGAASTAAAVGTGGATAAMSGLSAVGKAAGSAGSAMASAAGEQSQAYKG